VKNDKSKNEKAKKPVEFNQSVFSPFHFILSNKL